MLQYLKIVLHILNFEYFKEDLQIVIYIQSIIFLCILYFEIYNLSLIRFFMLINTAQPTRETITIKKL